jgi:hypothetical protein
MLESIDKRHRAFSWTGNGSCSGARCLIVLDKALLSKQEGGFSITDLHRGEHVLSAKFCPQITPN